MSRFLSYIGWIVGLLWLASAPVAAVDDLYFKPLNISSELSTKEIRNLYQDREGYIWISSYNGLLRYDGYSVVAYRSLDKSLGQNMDCFINTVSEDLESRIWIGTQFGLYVLDKRTEEVCKVSLSPLNTSNIETLLTASNGDVYIGSNTGLYRKRAGSESIEQCHALKDRPAYAIDVKALMEDRRGHIWIGTWTQGLIRYDVANDCYYHYKGLNPRNSSHALFQDDKGRIWIGTWLYGLLRLENPYDMRHFSVVSYRHDKDNPLSIADDIIYTITQDPNTGKLWIGSRSGLSILDEEEGVFRNYQSVNGLRERLPFNEVDALLCSKDGLMWVGMLGGGIYTVNTHRKQFSYDSLKPLQSFLQTNSIRCISQSREDELWLGVRGFGLIFYNLQTGQITPYNRHSVFKKLPYISCVNDIIYRRKTGEYCIATWDDGIWFYDGKDVRSLNLSNEPKLTDYCIYALLEDAAGNLWIGARNGLYMMGYQGAEKGKIRTLNELTKGNADLRSPIFKMAEDGQGNIWVATPNSGIWRLTPDGQSGTYTAKRYTAHLQNFNATGAMMICADSYDRIWAGSNNNTLSLYDSANDRFVPVFEKYIHGQELVSCIIEDDRQTLWLTTHSYMYHIAGSSLCPDSLSIEMYTVEDGLQDNGFNRNACYKSKDGTLYFGGTNGLNYFNPAEIACAHTSSPIVVTDFRIYGSSVRNMPKEERCRLMDAPLGYVRNIVLAHDQNDFSIYFSLLNYINPQLNQYEYRLEGYDMDWISSGADRHFAHYSNLPVGNYTFLLKGANGNGVRSSDVYTLHIQILPSPWLSGWAVAGYVLLLLLILCYIYKEVKNRLRLKHAVEIAYIQRQKQEEVDHAKLQFFTDITHELLSPLSIISASADELKMQYPDRKNLLQQISDNTLRLTRLIQQILEFRKVEDAQQKLKVSQGNLTQFLKHAVQAFAPLVRKKQLCIRLENCDTDCMGYFDPDKLDKIVYNLLSNAAKYTPEGGTITLRQEYDAEQKCFAFSFNNPGEPIPADKQVHLFERFYEGEYRKFHTIGTGIGLSLTKDLVSLHHGIISVHCDKETGNTFVVKIPVSREAYPACEIDNEAEVQDVELLPIEEQDKNGHESVGESASQAEGRESLPALLLVEDDEELRKSLSHLLASRYRVFEAENGRAALEMLHQEDIAVVVSDILMPVMDGLTLCRQIKAQFETRHIPVILLTAKVSDEDQIKGYEAEADGYVCKPVSIGVLSAQIENCLRKQQKGSIDARKTLVFTAKGINYTSADEAFLQKVLDCVNAHLSDSSFDATAFIRQMGMSRTNFSDHLKQLTGMTPAAFISNARLQTALQVLQQTPHIRIAELAYAVGFNDPKYFTLCFRKKFGASPREYLQQHPSLSK